MQTSCIGDLCGQPPTGNSTMCSTGCSTVGIASLAVDNACHPCIIGPSFHGWLYLGFTALLPVLLFFFSLPNETEQSNHPLLDEDPSGPFAIVRVRPKATEVQPTSPPSLGGTRHGCYQSVLIFALCCSILHACIALLVLLLFSPTGSLWLHSCEPQSINDFYAAISTGSGCIYQIAFPYVGLPLLYYVCSGVSAFVFLSLFLAVRQPPTSWFRVFHTLLYAYPVFGVGVGLFGGLLYFAFPHLLFCGALIHSAYLFPRLFDYGYSAEPVRHLGSAELRPQADPRRVFRAFRRSPTRYLLPLLTNAFCIAYSLLPVYGYGLTPTWLVLSLVAPVIPFLLYLVTLPLTHPFVHFDGDTLMLSIVNYLKESS